MVNSTHVHEKMLEEQCLCRDVKYAVEAAFFTRGKQVEGIRSDLQALYDLGTLT